MQDPSEGTAQRKPNWHSKLKSEINNIQAKFSPPQPSRTAAPGLSAQGESSKTGGDEGVARSPEITISPIDYGGDSSKGRGVAAINTADAQSKPDKDKKIGANPTPKWEAWNIDGDAITQLREWGAAHADSNWLKLWETIDRSLKSKTLDALKEFIPDSPMPARTLVKALLNLVELGINIPLIQKKVYEFAQEAIEYISTLVGIVGEELSVLKGDLNKICVVVNDVCRWAKERVSVKSVSADDLEDWRSKLTKAKETFLATAVTSIWVDQAINRRNAFIKEKLASHIAANYEHKKKLCTEGTRVEPLADIEKWIFQQPSNGELILWATGIAGCGKSTLSATIVDNLRKNHTPVAAQFFISRNIPETIDPDKIIPTIAQQLAISSPTAARILEMALKDGYPGTLDEQVTSLLLDPIRELSKSRDVVVILIDALDELNNAYRTVPKILSLIAPIDCDLPNNIRFIITSRPEHWADISPNEKIKQAVFKQYSLATDLSVTDVHNFLVVRMKEITPPDWDHWPDRDQLKRLLNNANGLFHYAATALQWIEQRICEDGTACRESVLQRFSEDGLDELEGLYKLILTSWEDVHKPTKDNDRRANRLGGFQHVMGAILVLREPLLIHEIVKLLSDIPEDKCDVKKFLQNMSSVLIPDTTMSFLDTTPQVHKSFRDYTISERAPPGFRIMTRDAHFKAARRCLDIIVKARTQDGIDYEYAVMHWYGHMQEAAWEGAISVDDLENWKTKLTKAKDTFLAKTVTSVRVDKEIAERLAFIKENLASHIAAKYTDTDQNRGICADGTRVELLEDIEKWIFQQPSNGELIFWVTGMAGSGKSTIAATIVENLRQNRTPVSAQFFISQSIPETMDPEKIIPTIAQQLAVSSPTAARVLEMALKNGYPATYGEQVTSLLLDPIRELSKSRDVVIILIDALDELKDAASVMEILYYIAPIDQCDLPNNIRFIITSRPKNWIDISMSEQIQHAVFKQYSLETETELRFSKVHDFVVARMEEIVTKRMELAPNEPDWRHWPGPAELLWLSNKANGQIHYAVTALQWIEQRIGEDGMACRESVFKQFSEDGVDKLEGLYKLILTSWEDVDKPTKDNDRRATQLGGFQHVMGTILVLREPLLVHEIIALLSDIPKDKFDVTKFLQQMRSVLIPGTTPSFYNATPEVHKSFRDYIMSKRAPPGFRILTRNAHFKTAGSCLDIIVKAGSQRGIDDRYAVTHWYGHLQEAVREGATCDDERMWTLLGKMVNEGIVGVWTSKEGLIDMFKSVATTAWQLLKQNTDESKLVPMSNILMEIKLALLKKKFRESLV